MVRDNLSLAIAISQSADNGLITPLHILPEDNPLRAADRTPTPPPNSLSRRIGNQVRAAFGFSVLQTQQSLERVYSSPPLEEPHSGLRGARCTLYLLSVGLRLGLLSPVWACPPEYQLKLEVPSISYVLDVTLLDGTPMVWEQLGGLGKYLELLDYCADWVQAWSPETAVHPVPSVPDVPAVSSAPTAPAVRPSAPVTPTPSRSAARPQPADMVVNFVESRCYQDPGALCLASALFQEYRDWCLESPGQALTQRSFGVELTKMGFQRRRRGQGYHWWQGIGLAKSE